MRTITFSHRYKKMPHGVEWLDTWIKDVSVIDYSQLTEEQIKLDTETMDGKFYPLTQGRLIWIKLYSDSLPKPTEWGTLRPFKKEKFKIYKNLFVQKIKNFIK